MMGLGDGAGEGRYYMDNLNPVFTGLSSYSTFI